MKPESQLLACSEGRRMIAKASAPFFARYYLELDYAEHQAEWLSELEEAKKRGEEAQEKQRVLVLAPRDHGKTSVVLAAAMRWGLLNRDLRVLWVSANAANAEKRVRLCKSLLGSKKITEDWDGEGDQLPFRGDGSKWTATQIYLCRDNKSLVDPSIESVGTGNNITGGHFDIIIADDIEDDKTVYSPTNRQRTRNWLHGTLFPMLSRSGLFIAIATRKHHDDVYSYMLASPAYQVIQSPAIISWPESHSQRLERRGGKDIVVGVDVVGESKVLWPDVRPIEYLLKERYSMGPLLFEREFQNQVRSEEDALFRAEWVEDSLDETLTYYDLPPGEYTLTQGWDLALCTDAAQASAGDRDWSVGTTLARRESDGRYFVASIVRFRGKTPDGVRREVEAEYLRYDATPPVSVAVERNNFGALHLLAIQQDSSVPMPLVGHETTRKKKTEGLPALAALFETHRITLPNKGRAKVMTNELMSELTGFGIVKHDDMVLSLLIAYQAFKRTCTPSSYVVDLFDEESDDDTTIPPEKEEESDEVSYLWESVRDW